MSEIKTCTNCGNLQTTGEYCAKCGSKIQQIQRTRMEARLLFSTSMLIFLGWMVIALGLFGGYKAYLEVRTWGVSLESETPTGMPVVGNVGYTADSVRNASMAASLIIFTSLSFGALLIGLGRTLTLVATLHDEVYALRQKIENG